MSRRGFPSTLGAMGAPDLVDMAKNPERTYLGEAPYGSMDPQERIDVLDAEHIDTAILYTTVGLLWEAEVKDPALSQAYTKAYNRWICEFCADEPRLVPTAHLSLTDVDAAAKELERAVGEGAKGGYVAPFHHDGLPLGHPDNDPVFAAAQDLDVPLAIHPTFEPQWTKGTAHGRVGQRQAAPPAGLGRRRRRRAPPVHDAVRLRRVRQVPDGSRSSCWSRGAGWIGYWLDRIDAVFSHTVHRRAGAAAAQAERLLPRADLDQLRPRRADDPGARRSATASSGSCGRRTSRTPTTRPSTSTTSTSSSPRSPRTSGAAFIGGNARALFKLDGPFT